MSMENLLSALYHQNDSTVGGVEKTAEDQMLRDLTDRGQVVEENPYSGMSDDEFMKLANDVLGNSQEAGGEADFNDDEEGVDEDIEKIAADALGGNLMAHSFWHELGQIKVAMINGKCRVCKANDMDVEGYSICSSCQATDDE